MTQLIIRFEGVSGGLGTRPFCGISLDGAGRICVDHRPVRLRKDHRAEAGNGLLSPDTGRVLIQGQDVARIRPGGPAPPHRLRHPRTWACFPHDRGEEHACARHSISGGMEGKQCREKSLPCLKQVGHEPAQAVSRPARRTAPAAVARRWPPVRASADGRAFGAVDDHSGPAAG